VIIVCFKVLTWNSYGGTK